MKKQELEIITLIKAASSPRVLFSLPTIFFVSKEKNVSRGIFILFFLFFSLITSAQVTSSVDTTQIRIGEEIRYTIYVEADTTDLVVFPEGQTFLPLEVIESYKVDTTFEARKMRLIKKYGLTQFDSGAYTIPPQRVVINQKAYNLDSLKGKQKQRILFSFN